MTSVVSCLRKWIYTARLVPVFERNKSQRLITNFVPTTRQIQRPASTGTSSSESPESGQGGGGKRHWWQTSNEFKIITTIVIGAVSWVVTLHFDRKHAKMDVQLEHVSRQIRDLYGPLYGNRLIQEKTYMAVMGEHGGLKNYLRKAQETKDADMIRRWRSFVWNVLYPLDKQAESLICKNAHLIANSEFPEAFDHFLTHLARLQFVMERWKNEDGVLESVKEFTEEDFLEKYNASGERGIKEVLHHVTEKYKELREIQKKLKIDTMVEDGDHTITEVISKISRIR
ncbi:uncharacterized protein LOC143451615 [Clavelina lepadiformis]|uniref:uncharacterized protein LOC143451615 n=1 Tax=Clavelina lepadiformis TaxID=159417 RepID=UPI004042E12D